MSITVQSRLEAVTAFPSQRDAFPAATFFEIGDAISYAMSFSPKHAACTCPALSFPKYHMGVKS